MFILFECIAAIVLLDELEKAHKVKIDPGDFSVCANMPIDSLPGCLLDFVANPRRR